VEAQEREQLLAALEKNAKLETKELAQMLGMKEKAVAAEIKKLEQSGIIRGYHTLVDWDKADDSKVSAMIEVSITPQRGNGYDKIAEKIYRYPEVVSLYLTSGGYDLMVILHNATMREISNFVSSKIAIIDGVQSTVTHFVLQRYKDRGYMLNDAGKHKREMVTP